MIKNFADLARRFAEWHERRTQPIFWNGAPITRAEATQRELKFFKNDLHVERTKRLSAEADLKALRASLPKDDVKKTISHE